MTKYTIIDIDLNINIDELATENALHLTGKAGEILKDTIQDIKDLAGAVEDKKKEKDVDNDFIYKLFKDNKCRMTKAELSQYVPSRFKTFSTMIMRFGNYLRRRNEFEYLRKVENKDEFAYYLESMPLDSDTITSQEQP